MRPRVRETMMLAAILLGGCAKTALAPSGIVTSNDGLDDFGLTTQPVDGTTCRGTIDRAELEAAVEGYRARLRSCLGGAPADESHASFDIGIHLRVFHGRVERIAHDDLREHYCAMEGRWVANCLWSAAEGFEVTVSPSTECAQIWLMYRPPYEASER